MLSTIPNVKRAEISSTSPKATSQAISHHNPQLPGSESNKSLNSKKNESLTALSFSNDPDGKVEDAGLSKEEKTQPIFDGVLATVVLVLSLGWTNPDKLVGLSLSGLDGLSSASHAGFL